MGLAPFFLCARQGALTCWFKSNAGPARGTASRTARVSTARWNPKEAAGKTLVRRTGTRYEANMTDKKANIFKVQTCPEVMGVYLADISVAVSAHYPGRSPALR